MTIHINGVRGVAGQVTYKDYSFTNQGLGAGGTWYTAGFYDAPAGEAALNDGNLTQTYGTAGRGYGAHVFVVGKGDGATDGSDLVLTVTGISITDAGARNDADTEVIVTDALLATFATNTYYESTKKWLGQITITLSSTAGGTFNCSFNYGFCKYEDFGNRNFKVTDFECTWLGGAGETGFDLSLCHHKTTGWTYSAAAFVPGPTALVSLLTDYGAANDNFVANENYAYKRSGLTTEIDSVAHEGVLIRCITAVNNSVESLRAHIGAEFL